MIKKFFVLLILLIISTPVFGETIKGGVSYTVEEVRAMAFSGVKKKLPRKLVKDNQIDPNFDENKDLLAEKDFIYLNTRIVVLFEDGSYSVVYTENMNQGFHYSSIGNLEYMFVNLGKEYDYPFKAAIYDKKGILKEIMCFPTKFESYWFDVDGKLIYSSKN